MVKPYYFSADLCLKCSICNTVCPVYAVNPNFPGPKFIGPEFFRLGEMKKEESGAADYCTGCRQCELACPNSVPITYLAHQNKTKEKPKPEISLRDWILGYNQWVSRLASLMPDFSNAVLNNKYIRLLMEKILGMKNRSFPRFQKAFSPQSSNLGKGLGADSLKVAYFVGCYSQFNEPNIAQAVISILERCGVEVVVPPQKCCGVPMFSNGLIKKGTKNAKFNLRVLGELVDQGYQIVTSCPSCALSLKQEYGMILDYPQAEKVAAQVYDISEFLLHFQLLEEQILAPINKRYFYHQPCHTKVQGIGFPGLALLRLIPELTMANGEQKCCGQAGTYGFKKEKYDTSLGIAKKLFLDVADSDADKIVTECGMCSLQLAEGTGKIVLHPAEVLDASMRLAE